jgi:hypothetical protein
MSCALEARSKHTAKIFLWRLKGVCTLSMYFDRQIKCVRSIFQKFINIFTVLWLRWNFFGRVACSVYVFWHDNHSQICRFYFYWVLLSLQLNRTLLDILIRNILNQRHYFKLNSSQVTSFVFANSYGINRANVSPLFCRTFPRKYNSFYAP